MQVYSHIHTLLLLLAAATSHAQTISLDDAIRMAINNNPDMGARKAAAAMAKAEREREKAGQWPMLKLETGMQRNFVVGTTPVPARMFDPNAQEGEMHPARFGTPYNGNAGISIDYDLFNPQRKGKVKTQRTKEEMADIDIEMERERLVNKTRIDYAATLLAEKQLELCAQDTATAEANYNYLNKRCRAGRASRQQLIEAAIEKNESLMRWNEAEGVLKRARQNLGDDLGCQTNHQEIRLTDTMDHIMRMMQQTAEQSMESYNQQKQMLMLRIAKQDVSRARTAWLPTVTLTGYCGSGYYAKRLQLTKGQWWHGNSYLAIKLSFPITKIGEDMAELRRSRAAYQQKLMEIKGERRDRDNKISTCRIDMERARQDMALKKKSCLLAEEKLNIAEKELKLGNSHPAQVDKERKNLLQQNVDYLQAIYNYFVAMANYLYAVKA